MKSFLRRIDWILFAALLPILAAGLVTIRSFSVDVNQVLFWKQVGSIIVSFGVFFALSFVDWRFLRRSSVIIVLYGLASLMLTALLVVGHISRGAQSWFRVGIFAFEPVDIAKIVLIVLLAKYFSRRHIEIAHIRHIFVSGAYALVFFLLALLQPDFGSSLIIFAIWIGMVLVSGISKKHLFLVFLSGAIVFFGLWTYGFREYQKERIRNFINPFADTRGSGYNAFQSMVAAGSGQVLGKGLGYGTQSRLNFLPEYQTDFVFAAFSEEWGFVGVMLLFVLWGILIWRILHNAVRGASNFEILYGMGISIYLMSHFIIHVGMNIGLLPVTGLPLPFMSYGGSHLLAEFTGLGILMGMGAYSRDAHKEEIRNEFSGL